MGITLYGIGPSAPTHAVRMMLDCKGLEYKMVWLLAGIHPFLVRTRGFRGSTVPAMKIDGRRIQNSREMSRALDEARPEPALFPRDPELRNEVEEAERWGEEELQQVPRRIVRWLTVHRPETRLIMARDLGVPFPRFAAWINAPAARRLAKNVDADQLIGEAIADVAKALDHADDLIERGVIGGGQPNAAEFQVATSLRSLMEIQDLRPAMDGRPATDLAVRMVPEYGTDFPAGLLPAEWLAPLTASGRS
jgi:glutathione S-transferase